MTTAILDRTFDRTTTLTPVLPARSAVNAMPVVRRPRRATWRKFAWFLSALLVVGVNVTFEPWKLVSSPAVKAATLPTETARDLARVVSVERPTRASTASVVLPATFRPWQTTTLHARVSGYLGAWHRDLGASVKAGEILAEIETPELDQELAEGKAMVFEASAAVTQAKAERIEADADLSAAEAQLVRIESAIKLTKIQVIRREKLLPSHAISQEEYDTFVTQLETQTAELAAAKAEVAHRRSNLETRTAIINSREATVKSRQSNVDRLQELQTFKRIVAPFDGIVTQRAAEVGMLVTAGKESLFTIEDMSRVRVQINVPQTYSLQTRPGVVATISVPESSVKDVPGTITRISEAVDSTNRTMLAEIELANAEHRFQPGSYAQVNLITPQNDASWTIPTNTVSMRVEGPRVVVVNDQDQIEFKSVTLGRDLGKRIVVVDGIHGGERLVVNPSDDLVSGLRIQIHNGKTAHEVAKR